MTGVSVMTTTVAYHTDTNDCLTRFVKVIHDEIGQG
jgi:hypothetical protein